MSTITSTVLVERPSVASLSKPVSAWRVCLVTIVKELQMARRYLPDLIGRLVEQVIRLGFYFLMSTVLAYRNVDALAGANLSDHNLFIFLQASALLMAFSGTALSAPMDAIGSDLYNGTLEFLYSGSSSRYAYFVGTVISAAIINQFTFIPLYIFFIVSSGAKPINMLMVLLVCMLALVTLVAMGIMIGLLALIWRQAGSFAKLLGLLFEFLAGAYLPLSAFPQAVQYLSYLLPYTWGYDLMRYYSFDGQWKTFMPVWVEWSVLALFAVVFVLLSRFLLQRAELQAKKMGLHLL